MNKKLNIIMPVLLVMLVALLIVAFKAVSKINDKNNKDDSVYANERAHMDHELELTKTFLEDKDNKRLVKAESKEYDGKIRGVSFWGDSMTEGVGDDIGGDVVVNGIPYDTRGLASCDTLSYLTGLDTYNMGRSGETSDEIARREGGLEMFISDDVDVANDAVRVDIVDEDGNKVMVNNFNGYGCSDVYHEDDLVYIDGRRYKVLFDDFGDSYIRRYDEFYESYSYFYKDGFDININTTDSNSAIHIAKGTKVSTAAAIEHEDDILVIEIGSNGGWNNYNELISQIDSMILATGTDYYIVVGDTDDPGDSIAEWWESPLDAKGEPRGLDNTEWENALEMAYGDHFLNTRLYMIENGLSDCGFSPTQEDIDGYNYGKISSQLRYDWTHFNAYGYFSQALAIYKKGVSLGYWS